MIFGTETNRPPTANSGQDQSVADSDGAAGENVTLGGSGWLMMNGWKNDSLSSTRGVRQRGNGGGEIGGNT